MQVKQEAFDLDLDNPTPSTSTEDVQVITYGHEPKPNPFFAQVKPEPGLNTTYTCVTVSDSDQEDPPPADNLEDDDDIISVVKVEKPTPELITIDEDDQDAHEDEDEDENQVVKVKGEGSGKMASRRSRVKSPNCLREQFLYNKLPNLKKLPQPDHHEEPLTEEEIRNPLKISVPSPHIPKSFTYYDPDWKIGQPLSESTHNFLYQKVCNLLLIFIFILNRFKYMFILFIPLRPISLGQPKN